MAHISAYLKAWHRGCVINEHYCIALLLASFAKVGEASAQGTAKGISTWRKQSCYQQMQSLWE